MFLNKIAIWLTIRRLLHP